MKHRQNGFGVIEIVVTIVVIGVLCLVIWSFLNNRQSQSSENNTQPEQAQVPSSKTNYVTYQTYVNKNYDINFEYPKNWSIGTNGWGGYKLDITFSSPDSKKTILDDGYSYDSGGEFGLLISSFGSSEIDIAYKHAAEQYLHKPTIDTTAELIELLKTPDALSMQSYDSPETIGGMAAGRGHFGHYTYGPWVFWVKNHLFYQMYYDGPRSGPDSNKYSGEFEALLKSIKLE